MIDVPFPKQAGDKDIWVSVQNDMLPAVIVGCVYRHPKAPLASFDYIQHVFRQLCVSRKGFYVLGDFSDDLLSSKNKLSGNIENNKVSQVTGRLPE